MNPDALRTFFMWCTILNGVYLFLASGMLSFAGGFVFRIHSRWFPMPRETFNAVIYGFLGFYKIVFITFNLVPWLALVIIG